MPSNSVKSTIIQAQSSVSKLNSLLEAAGAWQEGQKDPDWVKRDKSGKFSSGGGGSAASEEEKPSRSQELKDRLREAGAEVRQKLSDAYKSGEGLTKESKQRLDKAGAYLKDSIVLHYNEGKEATTRLGESARAQYDRLTHRNQQKLEPVVKKVEQPELDDFQMGMEELKKVKDLSSAGKAAQNIQKKLIEKHGEEKVRYTEAALLTIGAAFLGVKAMDAASSSGMKAMNLEKVNNAMTGYIKPVAEKEALASKAGLFQINQALEKVEKELKTRVAAKMPGGSQAGLTKPPASVLNDVLDKDPNIARLRGEREQLLEYQKVFQDNVKMIADKLKEAEKIRMKLATDSAVNALTGASMAVGAVGMSAQAGLLAAKQAQSNKNRKTVAASIWSDWQVSAASDMTASESVMEIVQGMLDDLRDRSASLKNPSNKDLAGLIGVEPAKLTVALNSNFKEQIGRNLESLRTQVGSFMSGIMAIETTDPEEFSERVKPLIRIYDGAGDLAEGLLFAVFLATNVGEQKISASMLNSIRIQEEADQLRRLIHAAGSWKEGQKDPDWVNRDKSGKFSSGGGGGTKASEEDAPQEDGGSSGRNALVARIESLQSNPYLKSVVDKAKAVKNNIGKTIADVNHKRQVESGAKGIKQSLQKVGVIGQFAAMGATAEENAKLFDESGELMKARFLRGYAEGMLDNIKKTIKEIEKNQDLEDLDTEELLTFAGVDVEKYESAIASANTAQQAKSALEELKQTMSDLRKASINIDTSSNEKAYESFLEVTNKAMATTRPIVGLLNATGQVDKNGKPTSPEEVKRLRKNGYFYQGR